MLLDQLPRDIVDFLVVPKLSLEDRVALRGTCRALRSVSPPSLMIEGRHGTWRCFDLAGGAHCRPETCEWSTNGIFQQIDELVKKELARTGLTKSFCRKNIRIDEIVKTANELGIPDPTAALDPIITRYYEEMMFFSWQESNVGPEFKGIEIYPPGMDDVHFWHNDAFHLANSWNPNDATCLARSPQMFSNMTVTVGRDFIVPLPPLTTESGRYVPNDLVMTNYHVELDSGLLVLTAHVRHNPLMAWVLMEFDLYAYVVQAHQQGMAGLYRQFRHRVKAAYSTTKLVLRGHDVEELFDPHLAINIALLGPLARQGVVQLVRTINAGTFMDGGPQFVRYEGSLTPPRFRLLGVGNVFPLFQSIRPSVCMPGCYLIVHERPNRIILVDTIKRRVSNPLRFPRGTGQSVIL